MEDVDVCNHQDVFRYSTATAGPARNWDMWNPSIGAKDALFARQQFSVCLIAYLCHLCTKFAWSQIAPQLEARYDMVFLGCWRHGSQQSWNLGMLSCEHWSFTSTKCSDAIRMVLCWTLLDSGIVENRLWNCLVEPIDLLWNFLGCCSTLELSKKFCKHWFENCFFRIGRPCGIQSLTTTKCFPKLCGSELWMT